MPLDELKTLNADQLTAKDQELRTELFKLRTNNTSEKVKDISKFKKLRKDIARVQTLKRQHELTAKQA
jgi:large subunit ribosomal protein L29